MEQQKEEFEEHKPWNLSYRLERQSRPSWTRQGLPELFPQFIELVNVGNNSDTHLDIGCGNGIKTVQFALAGFKTIGIDISNDGFKEARDLVHDLGLEKKCRFIKANCLNLPLKRNSIGSISDILCFTHLKFKDQGRYKKQLQKVLKDGGYILMVLFSDKDKHFHGHKVSKRYTFRFDPNNPLMEGYTHYHGMHNVHFSRKDIKTTLGKMFDIINAIEIRHPLYPHRFLWNVILRKI